MKLTPQTLTDTTMSTSLLLLKSRTELPRIPVRLSCLQQGLLRADYNIMALEGIMSKLNACSLSIINNWIDCTLCLNFCVAWTEKSKSHFAQGTWDLRAEWKWIYPRNVKTFAPLPSCPLVHCEGESQRSCGRTNVGMRHKKVHIQFITMHSHNEESTFNFFF